MGPLQQLLHDTVLPHQEKQQWLTCILTAGSTDLQVTINKDKMLTIEGERKQEHEENDEGVRRIERSYGVFVRRFQVCGCNERRSHLSLDAAADWLLPAVACKGVLHHRSGAASRWAACSAEAARLRFICLPKERGTRLCIALPACTGTLTVALAPRRRCSQLTILR